MLESTYVVSFRAHMGLRPSQRNESQDVTPAQAGVHVPDEVDSRFRGNDRCGSDFQESVAKNPALRRGELEVRAAPVASGTKNRARFLSRLRDRNDTVRG
jgi:hypothetical protein